MEEYPQSPSCSYYSSRFARLPERLITFWLLAKREFYGKRIKIPHNEDPGERGRDLRERGRVTDKYGGGRELLWVRAEEYGGGRELLWARDKKYGDRERVTVGEGRGIWGRERVTVGEGR
jgi:hypothetical protein